MSESLRTLEGHYLDGRRPIASPGRLVLGPTEASLFAESTSATFPLSALVVSPRTGATDRFISLPDGGQFQAADQPFLDALVQASPSEGAVAWLEQRVAVAVTCIAIVAALLLGAYFWGLPAAAKSVAARIPIETEQAMGREALAWLDKRGWFDFSRLPELRRQKIEGEFRRLAVGLPSEPHLRLEFRHSSRIGKNAFALPGGTIVITDQMVLAAASDEEVLSILAHEVGHVELRHTMRHLLQDSAIAVLIASITADAATLTAAVAGLPVLLAQASYSRDFESEADTFAFDLLKRHGHSPAAFASFMERLTKEVRKVEEALSFISTHPVSQERIERAREAAR